MLRMVRWEQDRGEKIIYGWLFIIALTIAIQLVTFIKYIGIEKNLKKYENERRERLQK